MTMHVMLVAPEDLPIPAERGGSVQIYLQHLYTALHSQIGIRVTLVSPGKPSTKLAVSGAFEHLPIDKRGQAYWREVEKIITKTSPDVLQVDNRPLQAYQLKRKFNTIPTILNLHSLTFLGPMHIRQTRVKRALLQMDAIVCNSRSLKETIRRRYRIQQAHLFHVIYPGVYTSSKSTRQRPKSRPQTPLKLLFVGRVIEQKGVDIAIKTVQILQKEFPIKLSIVGRTPPWEASYAKRLKPMAKRTNVQFIGFISPDKMQSVYRQHDILICPSQRHEAFGLVNLEAMQNGLPVVASHIGGIPEAVGKLGGTTIRAYQQPSAFAQAIREMRQEETYKKLSRQAIFHANRFTWKHTGRDFTDLYRNAR